MSISLFRKNKNEGLIGTATSVKWDGGVVYNISLSNMNLVLINYTLYINRKVFLDTKVKV